MFMQRLQPTHTVSSKVMGRALDGILTADKVKS